jgi:hypothetical protein
MQEPRVDVFRMDARFGAGVRVVPVVGTSCTTEVATVDSG